ncbi:glycosyltransferase [Arthrobacter sp. MDT1-48-3]
MFYGITRYSLFSPGSPAWKTSRNGVFKTPEEYMEYLFSEQRLNLRAEMFFTKAMPALAAMAKHHEYKHFVLYSELLPQHHQEKLLAAAVEHPFLIPVEWNETLKGAGIEEVAPLIEADMAAKFEPDDGLQPVVWFRLDDDDVLAADYLTHLEKYRALNHAGMAVSFGLGLTAYKADRDLVSLREFYHPKSAQGMAFVCTFDPRQRHLTYVAPGPHHRVDQVMPTVLDSREHMFFQVRHADQDSTLKETPHERVSASLARLEKLPSVSASSLSEVKWPSLINDMIGGEPALHESSLPGAEPLRLTDETVLAFPLDDEIEAGLVEFEFEFESSSKLLGGFAVVTYDLLGADGIEPESLGLRYSKAFGLHRQAWSKRNQGVVRHSILLPEGTRISGLTLRGKNRQPSDVFVRLRQPRVVAVHAGA